MNVEKQGWHVVGLVVLNSRICCVGEGNQSLWNWMNSAGNLMLYVKFSKSVMVK